MGLHKLTAGDGYTYLIRQVAALDSTERGFSSLISRGGPSRRGGGDPGRGEARRGARPRPEGRGHRAHAPPPPRPRPPPAPTPHPHPPAPPRPPPPPRAIRKSLLLISLNIS